MSETPTPDRILETLNAYQRTEALIAALDLDLFTHLAAGNTTPAELGDACGADTRGVRILADYLVVVGLLEKTTDGTYALTAETALYLDRASERFLGDATVFLNSPPFRRGFEYLTTAVRKGGTALEKAGTISPDHDVWVRFAEGMAPVMRPTAETLAATLELDRLERCSILDVAAGHGWFGIQAALTNEAATVRAVDWPNVLDVARANADLVGIGERFETLPGNAFDVQFGEGYDLVVMANFIHFFPRDECVGLLRKAHDSLAPGGRVVLLEYVPEENRVAPPRPAGFALVMLATTPAGDAYTYSEYRTMLLESGFPTTSFSHLDGSAHQVVIGVKSSQNDF